ncbi:phage major capsid protein [Cognatiluteimonas weifangensis]|uniref:Phage major capsid protein n=1 Tax=Cognatiluteimonas weifangensis TaxID=2303539 RepID=A0A372DNG4_9GAMM|nr:phage major capsid protein [Luteimonas weifangensis]RFP61108.1 phage major capsid protein [Luteimonas weifangensis]
MILAEIRQRKAAQIAAMRAVLNKADSEKRALSAEEAGKCDAMKAEIETLEQQEARQQFLDDAERRSAGVTIAGTGDRSFAEVEDRVSLLRVLQAGVESRSLDGAEAEYNAEVERRNGRRAQGIYMPMRLLETRVNTAGNNAQLVPTDHRPQDYIGALRNALLTRRLGVRVLSGLSGNVSVPKYGSGVTTGWVADNSSLTPSDMTHASVTLAPKHAGSLSEMSRSLIMQSSPDIEQLLRDDMAAGLATALDRVTIVGGGANEPDGVTATLAAANATLATPTWAQVLEIVKDVEVANALGAHAWLLNPAAKAKLAGTLKAAGIAGYLLEGGKIGDHAAYSSNQVPAGVAASAIFGDWAQVLLGLWSELDVLVNPYESTAYARGGVMVRAMATCDIGIRHIEAFQWADDVPLV